MIPLKFPYSSDRSEDICLYNMAVITYKRLFPLVP